MDCSLRVPCNAHRQMEWPPPRCWRVESTSVRRRTCRLSFEARRFALSAQRVALRCRLSTTTCPMLTATALKTDVRGLDQTSQSSHSIFGIKFSNWRSATQRFQPVMLNPWMTGPEQVRPRIGRQQGSTGRLWCVLRSTLCVLPHRRRLLDRER